MYTVEYQTEQDAVKEFHRTSIYFLSVLIVVAGVFYFFN